MSLRFLYVLLFTFILCIVSVINSYFIYYLSNKNRETLFLTELKAEAKFVYDEYFDLKVISEEDKKTIPQQFNNKKLYNKTIQIFNKDGEIVFSQPHSHFPIVPILTIKKLSEGIETNFTSNQKDFFGMHIKEEEKTIFISAYDFEGFQSLKQLKITLLLVFFTTTLFAVALSNIVIKKALTPLSVLNKQISETTENNLTTPVYVGKANSEVNKIALNYNEMLKRLNDAFKTQKNFVQHASHELRTPLATMYATTQAAIKNDELSVAEYKNILASLLEEQNNLIELTNSLLLLSQYEKLQHKPQWQPVRIDELMYDAMQYCKKLFSGIIIDFAFETIPNDENDLIIKANEVLLKSVFTNLTKNAFLYSDDKKINIILVATNETTEIHFENNGRHLSPIEINNFKQPFANNENVGRVKGFGLGLSIVQKILDIHHAKLIYTPMPQQKNRFTIKFK